MILRGNTTLELKKINLSGSNNALRGYITQQIFFFEIFFILLNDV